MRGGNTGGVKTYTWSILKSIIYIGGIMNKAELDKAFNLSGKWSRHSRRHNEAGMVCRCIYEHLREYYFKNGVNDKYVRVVCALEDLLQPSKLFVFITLGLGDIIANDSLIGYFVHSVLTRHRLRRPAYYTFIEDMDITDMGKPSTLRVSGVKDEIYVKEDEHE